MTIRWKLFCRPPLNDDALKLEEKSTFLKEDQQVWKISLLSEFIIITVVKDLPFSSQGDNRVEFMAMIRPKG